MNYHRSILTLGLALALALGHGAAAQDIIKANNTTALNANGSWFGGAAPSSAHTAVWNSTSSGTFLTSVALGNNLAWQGMRLWAAIWKSDKSGDMNIGSW